MDTYYIIFYYVIWRTRCFFNFRRLFPSRLACPLMSIHLHAAPRITVALLLPSLPSLGPIKRVKCIRVYSRPFWVPPFKRGKWLPVPPPPRQDPFCLYLQLDQGLPRRPPLTAAGKFPFLCHPPRVARCRLLLFPLEGWTTHQLPGHGARPLM